MLLVTEVEVHCDCLVTPLCYNLLNICCFLVLIVGSPFGFYTIVNSQI